MKYGEEDGLNWTRHMTAEMRTNLVSLRTVRLPAPSGIIKIDCIRYIPTPHSITPSFFPAICHVRVLLLLVLFLNDWLVCRSGVNAATAQTASTSTFVTAIVFNSAVFAIELAIFTLIRPYFKAVYEPRTYVPRPECAILIFYDLRSICWLFSLGNEYSLYHHLRSHGLSLCIAQIIAP